MNPFDEDHSAIGAGNLDAWCKLSLGEDAGINIRDVEKDGVGKLRTVEPVLSERGLPGASN